MAYNARASILMRRGSPEREELGGPTPYATGFSVTETQPREAQIVRTENLLF